MIGIDEVGRGAWAGPLLVCAARLNLPIEGLKDSKKLSAKQRQILDEKIRQTSDIGYGWVSAAQIDAHGLSEALRMATAAALADIRPEENEQIIIDGSVNFAKQYPNVLTVVRADDLYPVVSAASIVAKVARDDYMTKLAKSSSYGFEAHVGYGTARHTAAIKEHGLSAEHRRSFRLPS